MPRTDGTDDKRWYNLHVHWIYQSMTDTLCPGQIIKCDWLRLERTKLKSISGMCFFSKGIAESSDQVSNTPSFHSVQNFKAVLLVQRATGPPVLPENSRSWLWMWTLKMQLESILWWWSQCLSPLALTSDRPCHDKATWHISDSAPGISLPQVLE